MHNRPELVRTAGVVILAVGALVLAHFRPYYFNDSAYLGGLIFLQFLIAAIWRFRTLFFGFLMLAFLWAGLDLPLTEAWTSARWVVLIAGAIFGYVLFMHDSTRRFYAVHLVAAFCVLAAFVSALVSAYPKIAVLKAISLLLLFSYAGCGGRLAVHGREERFFRALLAACEIITAGTAVAYLMGKPALWGNPNSLGLVMGVGIAPFLFWGILTAETRGLRWRRSASFYLSILLLFLSVARASIIAGVSAIVICCLVLRRKRLLLQAAMLVVFAIAMVALLAPGRIATTADSVTADVFYKGHREGGVLGSRKSPWQQTIDVISEHPWFGSGFGTSPSGQDLNPEGVYSSNTDNSREHGSSYLAVVEWVGLLGVVPFAALLLMILWKTGQMLAWMSRTRCANHPAVPIVMLVMGTFIHAAFEDWLFAPGYYFTVFFWTFAFILFDLAPAQDTAEARSLEFFRPVAVFGPAPVAASHFRS